MQIVANKKTFALASLAAQERATEYLHALNSYETAATKARASGNREDRAAKVAAFQRMHAIEGDAADIGIVFSRNAEGEVVVREVTSKQPHTAGGSKPMRR